VKPSREITDAERALLHRFADVLDEGNYCPDPSPFHGDLVRRAAEEIERLREEIERLCSGDGLEYVMVCHANEQRDQALAHVERADNEAAKAKKLATSEAELRFKAEERIVELEAKCEMLSDDSVLMQEYEKKCARVVKLEAALARWDGHSCYARDGGDL